MNLDELAAQIEADERSDAEFLTPIQYARMRGILPQGVYYWIRNKKLEAKECLCGRTVIRVRDADALQEAKARRSDPGLERIHQRRLDGSAPEEGQRTPVQDMSQEDPLEEDGDQV